MIKKIKLLEREIKSWTQIVSPHLCIFCEAPAPLHSNPAICQVCDQVQWKSQRCPRCQRRCHPSEIYKSRCQRCKNIAYPFNSFQSIGPYKGALRQAILRSKFHHDPLAIRYINQKACLLNPPEDEAIWSFVPSHPKRLKERHSKKQHLITMTETLLRQRKVNFTPLLTKKDFRRPQIELNEKQRREALDQSYQYCGPEGHIEKVYLFDDVWSTGTTLLSACRVLKAHGIKKIHIFTLAFNDLGEK